MTEPGGPAARAFRVEAATLYVVATPIGNLDDVTLRALHVLRDVDVIAAEDTRHTRVLLEHHGIAARGRLVAYHDHVEAERAVELVRRLAAGESVALVSDAGTPLIADPGYRLTRAAAEAGVRVVPIPGACSPVALLSCAGLPTDRFTFAGFLPAKSAARRRAIAELAARSETIVLLESPHRLAATLSDLHELMGEREAVLGRELTKRFEELRRGTLGTLAARYAVGGDAAPRGEIVLAIAGRGDGTRTAEDGEAALDDLLRVGLDAGEPVAALARSVAERLGIPRRVAYQRALALKGSA
ncbi:16S rRNA (cytidine(1402)-2'-O)-methyltransferase [Candidatus Binatia bacterium]|nr:16S rRNA (cytidine(1402)-2'-O)-methyltransferase [Candidatus Binatia bacterium]